MTRTAALAFTLAALSTVAGCKQPASTAGPSSDTAAIEQQLRDSEAKWNQAYAAHDAAGLAGAYADDAALANPGSPLISGRSAIDKETAAFAADRNLQVKFASDRIQVAASGDLAYTRGHYTLTMTDPATRRASDTSGSYLTVWKKQSDGNWKAVEDFVVAGPPPPAAAE